MNKLGISNILHLVTQRAQCQLILRFYLFIGLFQLKKRKEKKQNKTILKVSPSHFNLHHQFSQGTQIVNQLILTVSVITIWFQSQLVSKSNMFVSAL